MAKQQKYLIGSLSVLIILYALFFREHFMANLAYKAQILKSVGLYFAIAAGGYMAAWLIIEKNVLASSQAGKIKTGLSFPFQPMRKKLKAEEYIIDVLSKNDRPVLKHGNISLKEHSLKVAEVIKSRNPLRIARLAALGHDIGKTMVEAGEYAYHDKLSFGMLNSQDFSDLTGTDRDSVLMAVKYHHDPYIPDGLPLETRELIETLKWADQTATYGEKAAAVISDKEIYQAVRKAFEDLLKTDGVINNTDFTRLVFYYRGEVFGAIEAKLREAILQRLDPAIAVQIGATIERGPGQIHPAFKVIRAALRDIIMPSEKGLHNLRSGKKLIKGVVLFDVTKLKPQTAWGEWPYDLQVLPWK